MSKISIIILNYNGEKLLPKFLPSVIQYSDGTEIIVVDNASTDNSISLLKNDFPSLRIIQLDKNYGYCGGYNRALQQIKSEYYLLLNSDVEVTANWLPPMLALLESDKTIAAVQPKILAYDDRDHFEYAGAGGGFIDTLGYPFCRGRVFDYYEKDTGQYNDILETFWASGACLLIRSDVFHNLNGFDENYFSHMEEIDLCWKIHRSGLRVFYCGQSTIYHIGAGTLSRFSPRKTYYNFRNGLSLIFVHMSSVKLRYKFPVRLLLDYIAALKFLIDGAPSHAWAVIQAHFDFLKSLSYTRSQRALWKSRYPFSLAMVYRGLVVFDYFIRRKKRIPFQ